MWNSRRLFKGLLFAVKHAVEYRRGLIDADGHFHSFVENLLKLTVFGNIAGDAEMFIRVAA